MRGRRAGRDHRAHGAHGGETGGGSSTAPVWRGQRRGNLGTKGVALGKVVGGGAHQVALALTWQRMAQEQLCFLAAAAALWR
jgi:hypothetical protein